MACSYVRLYGTDFEGWFCGKERIVACSVPGCCREAVVLCDGPGRGRRRRCDAPLCLAHAAEIATDHHLCPEHATGILGAVMGPRAVALESDIDDLTRCRDMRCPHRRRCWRWTDCKDQAVRVFDFGGTKERREWRCRWFGGLFE